MTENKIDNVLPVSETASSPTPVKPKQTRKRKTNPKVEAPPNKTLTTSQWLEDADKVDEYSQYLIDKKNNTYVNYNEIFSETKIEELLTELYDHIVYDVEKGTNFFNNHLVFNAYLNFLIIRYFTDMKDLLVGTLEHNIAIVERLRKERKFKVFFDEIFDNEQVNRVYERMNERTEMLAKIENMKEEQLNELLESIQTPFLKDKIVGNQTVN